MTTTTNGNNALIGYLQRTAAKSWETTPYAGASGGLSDRQVAECQEYTAQAYARAREVYEHFYG